MGSKSHMTENERIAIARGISEGKSFREIAEEIGKSQTTVSREIRKHLICEKKGCLGRAFNDCRKRFRCPADGCGDKGCRRNSCASCIRWCGSGCTEYEKEECIRLSKPPYVCAGCKDLVKCTLEKRSYSPVIAHKEYRNLLSSSREMIQCTDEEIKEMDRTISEGLAKGHSINHIYSYAGNAMPVSQRTAYEYINSGVFSESIRLFQPKAVRMKPRKKKPAYEDTAGRERFIGRTYANFLMYRESAPDSPIAEFDCVEGKKGGNGRVLLTILFRPASLQIAFVLDRHDSAHVSECIRGLRQRLGRDMYKRLFPVILTDRGSEFSDIATLEAFDDGEIASEVFFCDPDQPGQKGRCERNHSEIRRIIPKGSDITATQEKINLMMSNINSMPRPQFMNRSSYQMFVFLFGQDAADALGLVEIPAKMINLTPALLK